MRTRGLNVLLRCVTAAWIALTCAAPASLAAGTTLTLGAQAIDSGSAGVIGNSCFRLGASIGQPAPGYSAGGVFSLLAGFWAIAPAGGGSDTIFFDGFEGCKP